MSEDKPTLNQTGLQRIQSKIIALLLISLMIFAIAPIILSAIPNSSSNNAFSIYNTGYNGLSNVRTDLSSIVVGPGVQKYNVSDIISNLNVLNRFNNSGVLFIVAPSTSYKLSELISLMLFLLRGGSVVIADDFGTGNTVLKPIFDFFQNLNDFADKAKSLGFSVPDTSNIFNQSSSTSTSNTSSSLGNPIAGGVTGGTSGGLSAAESSIPPDSFITKLFGNLIVRFGFNHTAVLMDQGSNDQSPIRPLITNIDKSNSFGIQYTQNVNKIQMEMATCISVELKLTSQVYNGTGYVNQTRYVWQPLQKLTAASLSSKYPSAGNSSFSLSLPFFPLYSSRLSWMETNLTAAQDGTARPDPTEWGNANFATALTIPLFPGMGKIVFLGDPSIFINRWTENTVENDNMILIRNIAEMCTANSLVTNNIPVIFDFGHTHQGLTSPALYTMTLMQFIAEMSMNPLYAPFIPLVAYAYGKRLMPKSRRLRPILLTKRRGEKGHSDFEKQLEEIKATGHYKDPITYLYKRLKRNIREDVRYDGPYMMDPKKISQFFNDNYSNQIGSRRELESSMKLIESIENDRMSRRMPYLSAKRHLELLKKLIDLMEI